ncbi:hypothetical protein ABPG74_016912 [Tetrahymena malaccensis]
MKKNNFVLTQIEKKDAFKDEENTFKILVATDNHVGYKENDPIRGNDSFEAFEEVLKIAKNEKVDFLLLGGDLFHETNPSQQCLYKMLNLLGNHVLGDGEISYAISNYNEVNFQDCNLNIELPIFVIHGNHDYPSDEYGNLSVIDLLHATKYLNHFGKFSNIEQIKVTPIIFEKGNTTIALYGIGYLKDKYFHKMLEDGKIEFVKPEQMGYKNTVNILVIHQNRYKGIRQGQSYRNCVHPEQFPDWIDFIIRGHEVKIVIIYIYTKQYYFLNQKHEQKDEIDIMKECPIATIQPGSTILTAIEDVQATPRRAILFEIKGLEANFQDITLINSYRPVLYEHVELTSVVKKAGFDLDNEQPADQAVEEVLWQFVQQSINNFKLALKENFPNSPHLFAKKPILRFKIEQSNFDVFNFQRIESKLSDLVANPGEVLKFWKRIIINPKTIKNPKLEEDFIKTLKGKTDFDTIGNETVKDIKELYEDRIKRNQSISCLPSSLIMDTLEKVNLRNRNSSIEDIIKNLQNKLQENVAIQEEKEIKKVNEQYRQQMNNILQRISVNIDERYKDNIDLDLKNSDKIIYKTLMNNQFDDLRQSLNDKIRTKVAELFIQDFQQDDQNGIDIENDSDGQYKESSTNKKSMNYNQMDSEEEEDNKTSKIKGRGRKKAENKPITAKKQGRDFDLEQNDSENENMNDEDDENSISQQKGFKGKFNNSKAAKEKANQNIKNRKEIKVEDSSDQDEDKIEKINRRIKKSDKKDLQITENEKSNMRSGFKQKMTYAQLFKRQNRMDDEDEGDYEENQHSDEDASQQSDCEFGLDGEKQTKKISYNIAHLYDLQKMNQNNVKPLPLLQVQSKKDQGSDIKVENSNNFRQSILSKKKPIVQQDEPKREQKELDIRELMIKRINQANAKK